MNARGIKHKDVYPVTDPATCIHTPFLVSLPVKQVADIQAKLQELKPLLSDEFHVRKIGYFGSYATGEQTEESDLDLLVEFSQPIGWEFFTLEKFLEKEFGLAIDLVTMDALKERIKKPVLTHVKYV